MACFEIAEMDVTPGQERAFEQAVEMAVPLFRRAKGCTSFNLHRIVERPSTYRLCVGWETVEDHTVHFRHSASFQEWRRLASPFFAAPPRVDHVEVVI